MEQREIDALSDVLQGREPNPFCQCHKKKDVPFVSFGGPLDILFGYYRLVGCSGGLFRYVCSGCKNIVKVFRESEYDYSSWDGKSSYDPLREEIDKWKKEL